MKEEKIVTLRKGTLIFVTILVCSIVVLIFYNLQKSAKNNNTASKPKFVNVEVVANTNDLKWIEQKTLYPTQQQMVSTSVNVNQTAPIDSPNVVNTSHQINKPAEIKLTEEEIAKRDKEIADRRAPFTSNQLVSNLNNPSENKESVEKRNEKTALSMDGKQASMLEEPVSPYEVKEGTVIPGLIIKGINSELPGTITGQVMSNVYDTVTGRHLLIPQGTKAHGRYDSKVIYGQSRVLIVWHRLTFPNGKSMPLPEMPGEDLSGYSGLKDKVDNHYVKIFGSAILMSVLSAGAQLAQPQQSQNPFVAPSVNQTIAQSIGLQLANTGIALTNKNLSIPPTLIIRPGIEFNITVTKDLVFQGPYQALESENAYVQN